MKKSASQEQKTIIKDEKLRQIRHLQDFPLQTRLLSNHYDPEVHDKYWSAIGKTPDYKYNYGDSGLGFTMQKPVKFKNFKEKHEINQEILEKFQSFRKFKEFMNIKDGDVIVTIEYCTNCKMHSNSTRHDEQKYFNLAGQLKQEILMQFPVVKVLLKPLVYDPSDHSIDSLYVQKRIGAFEVQVCSRINGKIKEDIIFSKIVSKKWPINTEILERITEFLNKCNLVIEIVMEEDAQADDEAQKLANITATLKPYRNQQRIQSPFLESEKSLVGARAESGTLRSRPMSGIQARPKSAFSTMSTKTVQSLNRKIQENRQGYSQKRVITAQTDKDGQIIFKELPHDIYVIEISETNDFLAERQIINIFEMVENNQPLLVRIKMKRHNLAFCNFQLVDQKTSLSIPEAQIEICDAESQDSEENATYLKESPPLSGKYEIILDPGVYKLTIKREGYETLEKIFTAKCGTSSMKIALQADHGDGRIRKQKSGPESATQNGQPGQQQMRQQQQEQLEKQEKQQGAGPRPISAKSVQLIVYDVRTYQPIPNITVKLEEQTTKKTLQYVTNNRGECPIVLQGIVEGKMIIEGNGYFPITEEYGPTKLNLYNMGKEVLNFPLVRKPTDSNEIEILMATNYKTRCLDFHVISPDGEAVSASTKNIEIDSKFEDGSGMIKIKNIKEFTKGGIFRVYATLINPDILNPQHLKVYIINNKELRLLEVPKGAPNTGEKPKYWDIGFVSAPHEYFIEINAPTNKEITKDLYLHEYQELLNFFRNSKSVDLKTILGFTHRDKIETNGDIYVAKDKILNSLEKYGFEEKNIDHFLLSAIQPNGLFSFKKLEQKFSSISPSLKFYELRPKQKGDSEDEQDEYFDLDEEDKR